MSLFWRLVTANGIVFVTGALLLALLPVTVSTMVLAREAVVLGAGLVVLLIVNGLLVRLALAPIHRLRATMAEVDLLRTGDHLPPEGSPEIGELITAFNEMRSRLAAERESSNARALEAQEDERRRISRELHDEIGQGLTVVLLNLKMAIDKAPGAHDELARAQDAARESLNEVRAVAQRLRPGVLDDLGPSAAIDVLADELAASGVVQVSKRIARIGTLSPDVGLVLYRVAQEALTNVARHSRACHVEVTLSEDEHHVVLTVDDDGRGRDSEVEGTGIRGMRERALLVHADLTVSTPPTGGTRVRLEVPNRR